jgi:hypothetical protein
MKNTIVDSNVQTVANDWKRLETVETLALKDGRFHSPYGGIWEMETHRF